MDKGWKMIEMAIARASDLALVTLNVADYADFQGLQLRNSG